jgi:hypothetical protein
MNTLRRLRPQFGPWWKRFKARPQGKPARRSARLELLPLEARDLLSFTIAMPGVFNPISSSWFLRSSNTSGAADAGAFQYGGLGWFPVVGDWNGNGSTTIGAVDLSTMTWYLRDSNSSGPATYVFQFGVPGWIPVVGDWDGMGHTGVGAFDPTTATWYLRDFPSSGSPTSPPFVYGAAGWTPVTGDWNGDSRTNIGVVSPSLVWYLRDNNTSGAPTTPLFQYGGLGWTPVTGDWTGQGFTTIGAVDPGKFWYLRNTNSGGGPQIPAFQYGAVGWTPVTGDWTGALPQLAAGGPAEKPANAPALTNAQLQFEVHGAIGKLQTEGVDAALIAQLSNVQFTVGQLSGGTLALSTVVSGSVIVDASAAGYGWFVDPTPSLDNEFARVGGSLRAISNSAATGRMDLLTVILHELGHFDGWTELDPTLHPNDLMALTLATGERRDQALDAVFANNAATVGNW